MNIFQALYCNQYYELKPKGKEAAARINANRLLGISLSLNFISLVVLIMVISPDFADAFGDLIRDIFGQRQGRTVGKIIALVPFLIFMPLVQFTMGIQTRYDQLISRFDALSSSEQKSVSNKGLYYFIASMVGIFAAIALILIFLA